MKDICNIKDKAIVLSEKSTNLIISRKKSEIILNELSEDHLNTPIFFGCDKLCGILELENPTVIESSEFKTRYKNHKITEKEKNTYWGDSENLYAYSFKIKELFQEPIDFIKTKEMGFLNDIDLVVDMSKYVEDYYKTALEAFKNIKVSKSNKQLKDYLLELFSLYLERVNARKYQTDGTVLKPEPEVTDNYVRIRLRNPSTIVEGTFRTITLSRDQGIKAIVGRLKTDPGGPTHIQSVLFDKGKWTVSEASKWVRDHREDLK